MLNEKGRVNTKKEVVLREEEDGAFLFDPNSGRICHLNELGAFVWRLCQKSKTPEQMVDKICTNYPEISREQLFQDCVQFLKELERLEFLTINA